MRPRPFRVRPADDHELLAVQPFGFAPEATVSRRIRGLDRLRDNALKTEIPSVLQNEFPVARLMTVELKARLIRDGFRAALFHLGLSSHGSGCGSPSSCPIRLSR